MQNCIQIGICVLNLVKKMTKNIYRHLVLLLVLSILCIGTLPVVSAADANTNSVRISSVSPDQMKLINSLWGSDISVGEYMEKVHPEHLVGVPDDVKKDMYKHKMIWPDGNNKDRISALSSAINVAVSGTISKISSTRIQYSGTATVTGMSSPPQLYLH